MAFRKGLSTPTVGTIFFMVLATTNLSVLNNAKAAMQSFNQTSGDCSFTDFFPMGGIIVPTGRKTPNDEEAKVIFEFMKDKSDPVALGEVKQIIIEETPFLYHADALKALEKQRRLTVLPEDRNGIPIERRRNELGCKVSRRPMDPDTPSQRYFNSWLVRFHPPPEQEQKTPSKRRAKRVAGSEKNVDNDSLDG